ncbi:helix-turn-helix domain-containing protein [Listeria rustica]|uniref:Helix-turn-helix transcriptional regulator n=1 Tax=Listeria rustica TaxID=2713503 RepID=A0A7W1T5M3_9LIST|nr:AraC family transcriptional regulator [Listeria rustica]MBA3925910.1 helix-turn-helix transcriptional regulator [Listeria rustica]
MALKDVFLDRLDVRPHALGVEDLKKMQMPTTMHLTQGGELSFDDELYLTRWSVENLVFDSKMSFLEKVEESFRADLADFEGYAGIEYEEGAPARTEFITPMHKNRHIELCFVVEGMFKLRVQKKDVTLYPGEVLMLDCNTLHADYIQNKDCKVIFLGISQQMLDETVISNVNEISMVKFLKMALIEEKVRSEYMKFTPHTNKRKMENVLLQMFEEISVKDFGYILIMKGLLSRLLNALTMECDYHFVKSEQKGYRQLLYHEIEKYIEVNYRDIKLQDLVRKFNYSADYFSKLIKEITGMTYSQFLQFIRLDKAAKLLTGTGLPINKVASEVGYNNLQFFYQLFHAKYEMTPNEYRKKHR